MKALVSGMSTLICSPLVKVFAAERLKVMVCVAVPDTDWFERVSLRF